MAIVVTKHMHAPSMPLDCTSACKKTFIELGDRFVGSTGNVMVVREVRDGRLYLSYEDDPDDGGWEDVDDVVGVFEYRGQP